MGFDAYIYFGVGVGIATAIAALAYMFGHITEKKEYIVFAKNQIVEILIAFLILTSYQFLDPMLDNLVSNIDPVGFSTCTNIKSAGTPILNSVFSDPIPQDMPCYMGAGMVLLDDVFFEIKYYVIQITAVQSLNGILDSMVLEDLRAEVLGAGVTYNGFPGFAGLAKIVTINLKNISSYLLNSAMFLFFQKYLLLFFFYARDTIFGIALFLRLFPISRKLGGLLMAIVIAQMFVFPITYAIFDNFYQSLDVVPSSPPGMNLKLVRVSFGILDDSDLFGSETAIQKYKKVEEAMMNKKYGKHMDDFINEQNEGVKQMKDDAEAQTQGFLGTLKQFIVSIWKFFSDELKSIYNFIGLFIKIMIQVHVFLLGQLESSYLSKEYFVNGITMFDIMIEDLSNIMIYSYLMTFISVISWVALVKDLSPLLGGDIEIAGLSHFL